MKWSLIVILSGILLLLLYTMVFHSQWFSMQMRVVLPTPEPTTAPLRLIIQPTPTRSYLPLVTQEP